MDKTVTLDEFQPQTHPDNLPVTGPTYRHTKIIVTLGPATESEEMLGRLIQSGVDVMRLNMAHCTGEWVREVVARVRRVSKEVGRDVAMMIDVKGPEIRTGPVDVPIALAVGDRLRLCIGEVDVMEDSSLGVTVNYPDLPRDVNVGAIILVDSGLMRLRVLEISEFTVHCEVLTAGILGSRRHINLPGVEVNLPSLTDKDKQDLQAGVEAGIDFVALSFVRRSADVEALRSLLRELGSPARIIAKIEEQAGVRNMKNIIRCSDAIMVARGDLGIEIDFHRLPLVQTEIVQACQAEGKPVIIATHMLESMINSPIPTRAEISDVCNAVREQADAVMLSGETTTGRYPIESVEVLKSILRSIEPSVSSQLNGRIKLVQPKDKMLRSSATLAQDLGQSGIVVFTRSGFLAYTLGALRPRGVPIFAFTDIEPIYRQMLLPWGVEPFLMEFSDDPEVTIRNALERLRNNKWCPSGAWLGVITNALAHEKIIDTLQLRRVP